MTTSATPRSPGRQRDTAAHEAILAATHELLDELGYSKLSIEGVASRAGVGKATIYRWWPHKGALAVEAYLTAVAPSIAFPVTDDPRRDIEVQVHRLARVYRGQKGQTLRTIIGSGLADEGTMQLLSDGYLNPRRGVAKAALMRGVEHGVFRDDLDLERVIDAIYGPLFHRLIIGHAALDVAFIDTLLQIVLDGISVKPPSRAPKR
ncbi:TetR/AcrR family transcriptional regulator [Variovorax sp.]|jgi:AcrR family transcriptional regulator|uniref:TetR/AcrR family transcriptional regulator n=1 Tax=Variovorax sp. TaxID=1871043 RepID=UPI003BA9B66D